MRLLVGLACVAVIAFVGYFFWGEWQRSQDAEAASRLAAFIETCAEIEQSGEVADTLEPGTVERCIDYVMSGRPENFDRFD